MRAQASSALAIPPTAISGSAPPVARAEIAQRCERERRQRRARQAAGFARVSATCSGGREMVVFDDDQRVDAVVDRGAGDPLDVARVEIGRDLQEDRRASRPTCCTAASSASSAPSSCSARRPGVLGELMLIVR